MMVSFVSEGSGLPNTGESVVQVSTAPAATGLQRRETGRLQVFSGGLAAGSLAFFLSLAALLGLTFERAMFTRPDGIYTGVENNVGDLPFHLQAINSFAQGRNTHIEDPTFAGVRFTYPFMADYVSALLVRAGLSLAASMWLPNMVLALTFVFLLARWTADLTGSRLAGMIAILLVIFSGGMGWWQILHDVRNSDHGLFPLLMNLPHRYTIESEGIYRWGNTLTSLFVTQRSILFGAPIAVFIFRQWWLAIRKRAEIPQAPFSHSPLWRFSVAGVGAGVLPLVHTHTFLVVTAVAACEFILFREQWREWLAFFAVTIAFSLPQVLWLLHGSANTRAFFAWHIGWDHGSYNPLSFWLVNTGVFIPLLLFALLERKSSREADRQWLRFYAPFLLCFIVPNIVRLAPWDWDNIKVLFYWHIASVPLVAALLADWLKSPKPKMRWLAAGLMASLCFSGGLDVLRVITGAEESREFDSGGMAVARAISEHVPLTAVVMHAPTYDSPMFLTGRRSLLGYPGWAWSRGLDYSQREKDINEIYAGGPNAQTLVLAYNVSYALVGPQERAALTVNDAFWKQYSLIAKSGAYSLYSLRSGH
jgi:hypothetical protein